MTHDPVSLSTHFSHWWCNATTVSVTQKQKWYSAFQPRVESHWGVSLKGNIFIIKGHVWIQGWSSAAAAAVGESTWAAGMRHIRISCQTLFAFNITDVTALPFCPADWQESRAEGLRGGLFRDGDFDEGIQSILSLDSFVVFVFCINSKARNPLYLLLSLMRHKNPFPLVCGCFFCCLITCFSSIWHERHEFVTVMLYSAA